MSCDCNCVITIPSSVICQFNAAMDAFLKDPMCITATLVMPPRKVPCYCTVDSVGNKPKNFDFSGRPVPFGNLGNCQLCNGTSFLQEEVKEDICVRPYWNPKEWLSTASALNGNDKSNDNVLIVANNSRVQIKTYLYNLPKLLNAVYLEFSNVPGLAPYKIYRFSLEGEPVPYGLTYDRYCIAFFKRAMGG